LLLAFRSPLLGSGCAGKPRELVRALAVRQVAAGAVVSEDLFTPAAASGVSEESVAPMPTPDESSERIQAFNATAGPFRAVRRGRVIHVRSRDEPDEVKRSLERSTDVKETTQMPALGAVYSFVVAAMYGAEPEGGVIGTGIIPGPECPIDKNVTVPKGSQTALALLDEIVQQVPVLDDRGNRFGAGGGMTTSPC
jgi:hypothetical protein